MADFKVFSMESDCPLKARSIAERLQLKSQMSFREAYPVAGDSTTISRQVVSRILTRSADTSKSAPPARAGKAEYVGRKPRGALTLTDISVALRKQVESEDQCIPFFNPKETELLRQLVSRRGNGFFLRGWRCIFDSEGSLSIHFSDFCKLSARIGFVKNASDLYHKNFDSTVCYLTQIYPQLGALVEAFKRWISVKFESYAGFFDAFDSQRCGFLDATAFIDGCEREGFSLSVDEARELFSCCDAKNIGTVSKDDLVFLEQDPVLRERDLLQIAKRKEYEFERQLVDCYNTEKSREESPSNRRAIRPWIAKHFEDIPEVDRQRKAAREKARAAAGLNARVQFIRHIRRLHGNEVIAWRRSIDCAFEVAESGFRQACRQLHFPGDVDALWCSMDPDNDGILPLEQLSPQAAELLGTFRCWAVGKFGSCVAFFESEESIAKRAARHPHREGENLINKQMSCQCLTQVLKAYRFPVADTENSRAKLWFIGRCLDYNGCGFIYKSDFAWLDQWEPAAWLTAEPNESAWKELIEILSSKYGHLLRAWRFELDADNSNRLSWAEFRDACERLQFKNDVGGVWRWLDKDLIGWISLASVDSESSDIMHSFKDWAETRFGTMEQTFKAISQDNNAGVFSFHELRVACNKFKWDGNVRRLFDCLSKSGDQVSFKDAAFLSGWGIADRDNIENFKQVVERLWKEMLAMCPGSNGKATRAVCDGAPASPEFVPKRTPSGVAWGFPPTPKNIWMSVIESLTRDEAVQSGLMGISTHSMESLQSVPEDHCSPLAAFPGAPYALPVFLPSPEGRKPASDRKERRSWSQPSLLRKSDSQKKHKLPTSGSHPSLRSRNRSTVSSPASVGNPNGCLFNRPKAGDQLSRKRDPIGSVGGDLLHERPVTR